MFTESDAPLTPDAIDRILTSILTTTAGPAVPIDLDKDALRCCLNLCLRWYVDAFHFRSAKETKLREHRLKLLLKSLRQVEQNMEKLFWFSYKHVIARVIEIANLDLADLQETSRDETNKWYEDGLKSRSPFEWLVGEFLPDAYAFNFHRSPEIPPVFERRFDRAYARFVEAVLIELGLPNYSSDAIRKALVVARRGGTRRKSAHNPRNELRNWCRARLVDACGGRPPSYWPAEPEPGSFEGPGKT